MLVSRIDQYGFKRGDRCGVPQLAEDVGEFVFEKGGGVGETCAVRCASTV